MQIYLLNTSNGNGGNFTAVQFDEINQECDKAFKTIDPNKLVKHLAEEYLEVVQDQEVITDRIPCLICKKGVAKKCNQRNSSELLDPKIAEKILQLVLEEDRGNLNNYLPED